jgi:hypothetical protein
MLRERAAEGRLTGIVNGIDKSWDPRADKRCPYLFDPQRWKGRYADFIRGAFGLSLARAPLFAFVSRLVHQKGVDLVLQASKFIAESGGQIVVIGHGEPDAEHAFRALGRRHPEAVGVRIGFDPEEARALFAGGDFLLMPSRFEPCGLSQMVRPAPGRDSDRPSHGRSRRDHSSRQDRVAVRPRRRRLAQCRNFEGFRSLSGAEGVPADAPSRDGAQFRLARFGRAL